eukprot:UN20226
MVKMLVFLVGNFVENQFVATELKGASIPTCFPPDSNRCEMWGKLGCDLGSCEVETREVALLLQNGETMKCKIRQ